MGITLKGILEAAEATGQNPDGSVFNQRSLGYGDSKPLIVKQLPGVNQTKILDSQGAQLINEVSDNFIRGGAIGTTEAAATDAIRLGKLLLSPQGLAWTGAQAALARTNPKNLISPRNRLSSGAGTYATAITGTAGIRFRKDGLIDLVRESGYNYESSLISRKYEREIRRAIDRNREGKGDDTLLGIHNKLTGKVGSLLFGLENFLATVNPFKIPGSNIKSYRGGAHSVFGIGTTDIKRYKSNPFNDIGDNGGYLPTFDTDLSLLRQGPNSTKTNAGSAIYTDYRSRTNRPNNVTQTRIGLYNLGDPGLPHTERADGAYNVPVDGAVDRITQQGITQRFNFDNNQELKDYIKFRIAVVNTDAPLADNVIQFRAFLDSISDNYTGNWNSYKYNGRAEEFYTYAGFQRGINFNFKIHTQTRAEQQPLWNKLNYLVAQTAPEYRNNRMRGVFSRLTIGDWMDEIPGFFTSIGLSWSTAYPWEIQQDPEGFDSDVKQYPHILDVACTFQPVHNFAPSNSVNTPFILPNSKILEQSSTDNLFTSLNNI
jgi:hypothetical protein